MLNYLLFRIKIFLDLFLYYLKYHSWINCLCRVNCRGSILSFQKLSHQYWKSDWCVSLVGNFITCWNVLGFMHVTCSMCIDQFFSGIFLSKLGCVVRMVVDSILAHVECGLNDHREDAPLFIIWRVPRISHFTTCSNDYLTFVISHRNSHFKPIQYS